MNSADAGMLPPFPGAFQPLIINACLTGTVHFKQDNPNLPVTPEEIIQDALEVVAAGAGILHLHVRDEEGQPTWQPEKYVPIIEGIRRQHPDVVICVTTSGRLFGDLEQRAAVLELDGLAKPDMASLTAGSFNFPAVASVNEPEIIQELARRMREKNILPELEIFEPGMLNYALYLARKNFFPGPCYLNFIMGSLGTSGARVLDLANLARDVPTDWTWAAAGIGRYQLPINMAAMVMGGHVRVGLEDNVYYDYQQKTHATNRSLVERIVRLAGELGREI
ncbi:MAG: hypothetical protein A2521_10810, partial [Deltaproteobacteria bacterium RIFOXYD12_FULL_57_12]